MFEYNQILETTKLSYAILVNCDYTKAKVLKNRLRYSLLRRYEGCFIINWVSLMHDYHLSTLSSCLSKSSKDNIKI